MFSLMRKPFLLVLLSLFLLTTASHGVVLFPLPVADQATLYGEVKRGQGLYQALRDVSIENALALEIINVLSDEVEFTKLKVGDRLEATFNENNELIRFSFSQNPAERHAVKRNSSQDKWVYEFVQ